MRYLSQVTIANEFRQNFLNQQPGWSIGALVSFLLSTIYTIALIIAIFYFIWASYRILISRGDIKEIQAAKGQFTYAVVGLLVIFLAYGIYLLVNTLIGSPFT